MSIIITPDSGKEGRGNDTIYYEGNGKGDIGITVEVSSMDFDALLTARDYNELSLQSAKRFHKVKDYIEDYPNCFPQSHSLYNHIIAGIKMRKKHSKETA